jgi:hypothetical protein
MPYYVGAGEPQWDEYCERAETDRVGQPPVSLFKYVEPVQAKTTVLSFPEAAGLEPEAPQRTAYRIEDFEKMQDALSAHALWKISGMTAKCRAVGVKRVFGSYDGGGDESFTHLHGVEMRDGRVIEPDVLRREAHGVEYNQLIDNAAAALMGEFDAGEFVLRGAVIIDFDACTITDEKNAEFVFGDKVVWGI